MDLESNAIGERKQNKYFFFYFCTIKIQKYAYMIVSFGLFYLYFILLAHKDLNNILVDTNIVELVFYVFLFEIIEMN